MGGFGLDPSQAQSDLPRLRSGREEALLDGGVPAWLEQVVECVSGIPLVERWRDILRSSHLSWRGLGVWGV
jgi:hypothetical protein